MRKRALFWVKRGGAPARNGDYGVYKTLGAAVGLLVGVNFRRPIWATPFSRESTLRRFTSSSHPLDCHHGRKPNDFNASCAGAELILHLLPGRERHRQ